jgi:hypothetical protein
VLRIAAAGADIPVSNSYSERLDLQTEQVILFAQDPIAQDYTVSAEFAFPPRHGGDAARFQHRPQQPADH